MTAPQIFLNLKSELHDIRSAGLSKYETRRLLVNAQADYEIKRSSLLADEYLADMANSLSKGMASDTLTVQELIYEMLPQVGFHLQNKADRLQCIPEPTAQEQHIIELLDRIEPLSLATHGLLALMNAVLLPDDGALFSRKMLAAVIDNVSESLNTELKTAAIREDPENLKRFKKTLESGDRRKLASLYNQLGLNADVDSNGLAGWTINGILEITSSYFFLESVPKLNRASVIRAKSVLLDKIDLTINNTASFLDARGICYCNPLPWDDNGIGGFVTSTDAVLTGLSHNEKGRRGKKLDGSWSLHVNALNKVQSVAWQINSEIADLQQAVFDKGGDRLGLPSSTPLPIPREATKEDKKRISVYNSTKLMPEIYRTFTRLGFAQGHRDIPEFWFVAGLDARGRVRYLSGDAPNIHGSDLDKSLFQFASKRTLGRHGLYWLKVGLAGEVGHDKLSFDERCAWVDNNIDLIKTIADNPLANIDKWEGWDSPWRALALALDLCKALALPHPTQYQSAACIGLDATCSALQHIGAMVGDEALLKSSNVLSYEDGRRGDFYLEIGSAMHELLFDEDHDWSPKSDDEAGSKMTRKMEALAKLRTLCKDGIPRKIAKRSMCATYGSTSIFGQSEGMKLILDDVWPQLFNDLGYSLYTTDGGIDSTPVDFTPFSEREEGLTEEETTAKYGKQVIDISVRAMLAELLLTAMAKVSPKLYEYLIWAQQFAAALAKNDLSVEWTTPTGAVITNKYLKTSKKAVKIFGSDISIGRIVVSDQLNGRKMASSLPPNLIHSFDSAHLMRSVEAFAASRIFDFGTIHDCLLVRPSDAATVGCIVRCTFEEIYSQTNWLMDIYNHNQERLTEEQAIECPLPLPPETQEFDLTAVNDSQYFFS